MTSASNQKIAWLTPLSDVIAALGDLAKPVAARRVAVADANGRVLAADVFGPKLPVEPTALSDGWAVKADDLADASGYAPVSLAALPARIETGDQLPRGSDAVAPPDLIIERDNGAEAVGAVALGEGVAQPGSEVDPAKPMCSAGQPLRALDIAAFGAAGIEHVSVRIPRILVVCAREDLRLQPALQFVSKDCTDRGAEAVVRNGLELEKGFGADDCDAIIVIGGSGVGPRDRSVQTLAKMGHLLTHGIGLMPGETAAVGHIRGRPVLIVPGQLGSAVAVWLTLGRVLLQRLAGDTATDFTTTVVLSRKVPSTVGLAEFVVVRREGAQAEPLATRHLPLWTLTHANGWFVVPAQSEGFPAGAQVAIYSLP